MPRYRCEIVQPKYLALEHNPIGLYENRTEASGQSLGMINPDCLI